MDNPGSRKPWGAGRVVFFARLDAIRSELSQGYPLTTIYDRHQVALQIGYRSFCKLVSRYAEDAKLSPCRGLSRATASSTADPVRPAGGVGPLLASPCPAGPGSHLAPAGPLSAVSPTFQHHGIVQEGEPELLFGGGYLPTRKP